MNCGNGHFFNLILAKENADRISVHSDLLQWNAIRCWSDSDDRPH